MLQIELHPELEAELVKLSKETGRSESSYLSEAFQRLLEDEQDYKAGIASLEDDPVGIPIGELEHRLGLDK